MIEYLLEIIKRMSSKHNICTKIKKRKSHLTHSLLKRLCERFLKNGKPYPQKNLTVFAVQGNHGSNAPRISETKRTGARKIARHLAQVRFAKHELGNGSFMLGTGNRAVLVGTTHNRSDFVNTTVVDWENNLICHQSLSQCFLHTLKDRYLNTRLNHYHSITKTTEGTMQRT